MPPQETKKIDVRISSRFTHLRRLYSPGVWPVDEKTAAELVAQGRAKYANAPKAQAPAKGGKTEDGAPPKNPRISETGEKGDEVIPTPLPEDFPSREALAKAGFETVESLKTETVKEDLEKVEGLTPADITKIGLAISKI